VWGRLVGDRPIVTRLVLAVAGAMSVVLLLAGGFVFWRVQFALDRQLDQDLEAYQEVVQRAVAAGVTPPTDTPGQSYQVYDATGRVLDGNSARARLVDDATVAAALGGEDTRTDVGRFLPPAARPYRVVTAPVRTTRGTVVVASAISKSKHDEALRELLLQLTIADLATLAAASVVGYRTARGALNPVERYRRAAEQSHGAPTLPVDAGRDDEVTRLGHTFNALLARIERAGERERQFLADASHELRSPLALMRTELEVATLRPGGARETAATFASLRAQVERLITLANALLDLEELRAAGTTEAEQVDLDRLVAGVADRHRAQATEQGRRILTEGSSGVVVDGHAHWLDLAVANLVSNALRHGRGAITLTTTEAEGWVRLTVADEGDGFPDDFVPRAFDRFSRAEASRASGGTGLGLSLVQAVAEEHHGTATISGPAGVTITLPAGGHPGNLPQMSLSKEESPQDDGRARRRPAR
jgi:signal transduction histidine kinase